jgi:hypothetical protein
MNLSEILLRRADEQMQKPWLEPDRDEHRDTPNDPRPCEVCGESFVPRCQSVATPVCRSCADKGWRARRCECGKLLRNSDYKAGMRCKGCRAIANREAA